MIAIEKAKDLTKIDLDELLGSLMTHEIILKSNEENNENKKKREIAFMTSSSQINEEIKDDEVMRKLRYSLEDSIKYLKMANFFKEKEEEILKKKKNQRRILLFILNAKSWGT